MDVNPAPAIELGPAGNSVKVKLNGAEQPTKTEKSPAKAPATAAW